MPTLPIASLYFNENMTLQELDAEAKPYYRRYRELREEYENEKERQFSNIHAKNTLEEYNAKIIESRRMIELLENATDAQLEEYMVTEKAESIKYLEEQIEKKNELMDRYVNMTRKVEDNVLDSDYRDYLIEQLNISANQDCTSGVIDKGVLAKLQRPETVEEYRERRLSGEKAAISRYESLIEKFIKRKDSSRVNELAEIVDSAE